MARKRSQFFNGEPIETNNVDSGVSVGNENNEESAISAESVNGIGITEPDQLGEPTTPKRRGRKPGSKNKTSKDSPVSLAAIESLLISVHAMGASILNTPELVLEQNEAKMLADAIGNVAQYYPLGFDPKYIAWGNLGMVACGIYGTRIFTARKRVQEEKRAKPTIVQMPQQKTNGVPNVPGATPSDLFGFNPSYESSE